MVGQAVTCPMPIISFSVYYKYKEHNMKDNELIIEYKELVNNIKKALNNERVVNEYKIHYATDFIHDFKEKQGLVYNMKEHIRISL